MHLANEVLQHFLGIGKVGDNAVLHRTLGGDIFRGSPEHFLGVGADRLDRLRSAGTAVLPNGYNRRFIQNYTLTTGIDERIGGTQIDR